MQQVSAGHKRTCLRGDCPSFLHRIPELGIDDAPTACEHFEQRDDGWTKVILTPAFRVRIWTGLRGKGSWEIPSLRRRSSEFGSELQVADETLHLQVAVVVG